MRNAGQPGDQTSGLWLTYITDMLDIPVDLLSASAAATLAVGFGAGVLRGYTGFGGAIFAIPLLGLIYGPTSAIAVVMACGLVGTVQLMPGALPLANWRRLVPLALAAMIAMPFGTWLLLTTDPDLVRRGIGVFVLSCAIVMMRGWSWRGPRTTAVGYAVGAACGLVTGLGGVGGAIATLYFISSPEPVAAIRANLIVLIGALTAAGLAFLAAGGGVAAADLLKMLIYLPAYMASLWIGSRIFRGAPATLYRRVALWLLAAVGIAATAL